MCPGLGSREGRVWRALGLVVVLAGHTLGTAYTVRFGALPPTALGKALSLRKYNPAVLKNPATNVPDQCPMNASSIFDALASCSSFMRASDF